MGHAALEPGAENIPTYQNVEIGGGRITGTEVTPEHPEGIAFGMYHADQYSVSEAAEILGVSKRSIYNLCASGAFKSVRIGTKLRISKKSFDEWLDGSD